MKNTPESHAAPLKIRPIETEFTEREFRYTQIRREGDWAIYHQTRRDGSLYPAEVYEVVRITLSNPYPGAPNPENWDKIENYPTARTWGNRGFTVIGMDRAVLRMCEESGNPQTPGGLDGKDDWDSWQP